jgi:hypothetical protein
MLLDEFRVDFISEKMAVCCTDENGLVTQVLAEFALQGSNDSSEPDKAS